MPFFNLRRDDKSLDPMASEKTFAVMLHPHNLHAREAMMARVQRETGQGTARRKPFSKDEFFRRALQSSAKAAVAGGLLLTRLQLQMNGYSPSFNQAQPLVLALLPPWEQPTGSNFSRDAHLGHCPRSRSKMLSAWDDFFSVAHLWAALIHSLQHGREDIWPAPLSQVPTFLAFADCFLNLGCSLPSHERNRRVPLVRSKAWTCGIPNQMERIVRLEALPLTPEQRKILNDTKSPNVLS
jgi:hypothetical protein